MGHSTLHRGLHWCRALLLAVGLGLSGLAQAEVQLSHFPPNPGVLPGGGWQFTTGTTFLEPPPPRAWVNGVYGSVPGIAATDTMTLAGRAGALVVDVRQAVPWAAVGGAFARCLALVNPYCLAASVGYQAYKALRVHPDGLGTANPDGLLKDPGVDPTGGGSTACYTYQNNTTPLSGCFVTVQAAVDAARLVPGSRTCYSPSCTPTQQQSCSTFGTATVLADRFTLNPGPGDATHGECLSAFANGGTTTRSGSGTVTTAGTCPASTDALNPADNVPAGEPVGYDGKCRTARYATPTSQRWGATTAAAAGALFDQWGPAATAPNSPQVTGAQGQQMGEDAVQGGQSLGPASVVSSGPASQTGQPSVTTGPSPSGTGTKTVTTTNTYNYNYAGNTITYNTVATTTTNDNGTVTTTTTETPAADPAAAQDPEDPCTKSPDTLGCAKFGTPPTDTPEKKTKDVSYSAESFDLPAACPADVDIGNGRVLTYSHACDGMVAAKPFIIALSLALALSICLRSAFV